jgi:2-oxo-4-hydroxy-4-carboxy-5-ureidoimidazoline decarboxylase
MAWAQGMLRRQPFGDHNAMHLAADEIWWSLRPEDWLEAFSKHPRIGEPSDAKWSSQEQQGMVEADSETTAEVGRLNSEYYTKFGFIFIVCASGKSAYQMLQLMRSRIGNAREQEIRLAAVEQAKITHLRLDKLISQ